MNMMKATSSQSSYINAMQSKCYRKRMIYFYSINLERIGNRYTFKSNKLIRISKLVTLRELNSLFSSVYVEFKQEEHGIDQN